MWMMVVMFMVMTNNQYHQVGQVVIKNFVSRADCVAKMNMTSLEHFNLDQHNASVACLPQPR